MGEMNGDVPRVDVHRRREPSSVFFPLLLITIGVVLLLDNANILPPANWGLVWRLAVPLVLVFIGLSILSRVFGRVLGRLLNFVFSVAAIGVVIFLLYFGQTIPALADLNGPMVRVQTVSYPNDGVEAAEVTLEFGDLPAEVYALDDSANVLEAAAAVAGELKLSSDLTGGVAQLRLREDAFNGGLFIFPGPEMLSDVPPSDRVWRVGLAAGVPLDLTLDIGSAPTTLDLRDLTLRSLRVEAGDDEVALLLPDGDYEAAIDVGNDPFDLTLPEGGEITLDIETGSDTLTIYLPDSLNVRIEFIDGGSGDFRPGDRLTRVEESDADNHDGEVWQTEDYETGMRDAVLIRLDLSSGAVRIR